MSQDELAEKLGVSRQSVSLWETGQTQPTIDNIIALAKIFNVSTDAILGNSTEDMKAPEDNKSGASHEKNKRTVIALAAVAGAVICAALVILMIIKLSHPSNKEYETESSSLPQSDTAGFETIETDVEISSGVTTNENGTAPSDIVSDTVEEEETETEKETSESDTEIEIETERETERETAAETKTPETTAASVTEPETTEAKTTEPEVTETETMTEVTTAIETIEPPAEFDLYAYLKDFILKNGTVSGTYCVYQKPSSVYGGYDNENFNLTYWSDYEKVEFCLHCPLNDTFSDAFYITMRGKQDSTYEYSVSKYYRDNGESIRYIKGYINPAVFSDSYPLKYDVYEGVLDGQDAFLEEGRVGIIDLIHLIKSFVNAEKLDFDFSVFGFKNF